MTKQTPTPKPGTLIHGTMRAADLIPAFLDAVRRYAPAEYEGFALMSFGPVPAHVFDDGDSSEWWECDDCAALLEDLFNILNDCAPDGHYFGAHEGDGSDYGFWPLIDHHDLPADSV